MLVNCLSERKSNHFRRERAARLVRDKTYSSISERSLGFVDKISEITLEESQRRDLNGVRDSSSDGEIRRASITLTRNCR